MSAEQTELSLKQLVKRIIDWVKFLFSKWLIIGIVSAIFAGLGVIYAYMAQPVYTATVSFVLSNKTGSGGGLMGLASQFGLSLNGNGTDAFSGDNIMVLMQSRKMVQQVLLQKPDNKVSLLNMFVKDKKIDKAWAQNERTKNVFPFPDSHAKMTLIQDSLFREIYFIVQKTMLAVSKPEKDESIYIVATTSNNEMFSYYLTNYLVKATSAFYIDTKTSSARRNLSMLQKEADSIKSILGNAIVNSGVQTDKTFNLNPAYQVQRAGVQQNQISIASLGEAYGEVLKNLELAKITLLQETPLYQIIDEPSLPLLMEKPSKLINLIIGGFLGAFIIIGILTLRRIIATFNAP